MKILEDMILERGIAVNEDILKVDSFVNHQVDPELMKNIGDEFAEHFKGQGITKVATIAGVGILIEKSFQPGYEKLTEQGIDVYSLARIAKLGEGVIEFVKD